MDSDEALFERLIAGDMRAFDRLWDRYEKPLFGFVRAMLRDEGEAEDVLHDAVLTVLRERERKSEVRSFRAWIYEVARNLCLNRIRARRRAGAAAEGAAHVEAMMEPPVHAEKALEGHERAELLRRAVERLPATLAETYRMRAAGMSYEELAGVLGVPVGTVKSRMHEVVKRLREEVPG